MPQSLIQSYISLKLQTTNRLSMRSRGVNNIWSADQFFFDTKELVVEGGAKNGQGVKNFWSVSLGKLVKAQMKLGQGQGGRSCATEEFCHPGQGGKKIGLLVKKLVRGSNKSWASLSTYYEFACFLPLV